MKETVYEFENLKKLFSDLDRKIRYFRRSQEIKNYNKETLIRKKGALLETAQNIGIYDLMLLYYLKRLDRLGTHKCSAFCESCITRKWSYIICCKGKKF